MRTTLPVISPAQAAAWDQRASDTGTPVSVLMDAAGRAVAAITAARFPREVQAGVLVLVGRGHNGGDGWAAALALHAAGLPVFVTGPGAAEEPTIAPLTREVAARARRDGVREVPADGPWPNVGLVLDALLGTGASGVPRAPIPSLLARVADLPVPVVAVDGPTGLDLGTGSSHEALPARLTITFNAVRRGHLLAREECGDIVVADVGLPRDLPDDVAHLVTDAWAAERLPDLPVDAHKGTRGRVVIVGGAPGMSGAVRLATRSAFAAGAGLVWSATPAESTAILAAAEPDLQARPMVLLPEPDAATLALVAQADAVVIGPGLGRAEGTGQAVLALLNAARAAVLDADALVTLAPFRHELTALAQRRPVVCTPHPGEFRTLCPEFAGGRELDPWGAARAAASALQVTMLLKGVPTVVAREGVPLRTVAAGNPGLATGGSGDLLAGLVGAFLARGLPAEVAATLGAQALGRAADLAAHRVGARMLRPMDVVAALGDLWRNWTVLRRTPMPVLPPILLELPAPQAAP